MTQPEDRAPSSPTQPERPDPGAERGPSLRGQSIVLTRPLASGGAMTVKLREAGAEIHEAPAIEFKSLIGKNLKLCTQAVRETQESRGWLILPSPTAVLFFGLWMEASGLNRKALKGLRWAVVGSASAAGLEKQGLTVDFTSPQPQGGALAQALPAEAGQRVLIAGSSQTRPELRMGLERRGLRVQTVALYRPHPCDEGLTLLSSLLDESPRRVVVISSPSGTDAIANHLTEIGRWPPPKHGEGVWVALGPMTERRMSERGIHEASRTRASSPTAEGLIQAIVSLVARRVVAED
jgi:uroporphyrinogen-III synthase